MKKSILLILLALLMTTYAANAQSLNTLTAQEIKDGWKLLFDGKSLAGWRNYNKTTIGPAWKVKDGNLYLDTSDKENWQTKGGGDIITDGEFENFELYVDWKIEACGNSGIIFNVVESAANEYVWYTGPEIQMLDNCHPDGKIPKHRAGNLYDLIASKTESVKPGGEWNQYHIISNKGKLTIWLNDVEQLTTQMYTPEWEALIKGSKFKDRPDFGKAHKGHLSLQDHGNQVWFRNFKIKTL